MVQTGARSIKYCVVHGRPTVDLEGVERGRCSGTACSRCESVRLLVVSAMKKKAYLYALILNLYCPYLYLC